MGRAEDVEDSQEQYLLTSQIPEDGSSSSPKYRRPTLSSALSNGSVTDLAGGQQQQDGLTPAMRKAAKKRKQRAGPCCRHVCSIVELMKSQ